MNKNLYLFLAVVLLISCIEGKKELNNSDRVNCTNLSQDINGVWLLNNAPYTGKCESTVNGVMESYCEFEDGLVSGKMKYFFPNGQVQEEVQWANGVANGGVKYFYENGQLKEEGQVIKGSKEGVWKNYHSNGELMNSENWINNLMEDSVFSFFENGNRHSKGVFVNGKEDGRWVMYDSLSGAIDGYLFYENGIIVKTEKE